MQGLSIPATTAPKAPFIGVFFRRESLEHDGHVGLAWREKTGGLSLLHQRWHCQLTLEPAPDALDAVVQLPLPRANVAAVIHWARYFHKCVGSQLPYGLRYPNSVFDEKSGKLLLRRGEGLTCSTTVLALLELAGVVLVKRDEWPSRPDDEARHAAMVNRMQGWYLKHEGKLTDAAVEHLAHMNVQKTATRYRPAEVAGAAAVKPLPASFVSAETAGNALLNAYDGHFYPATIDPAPADGTAAAAPNAQPAPPVGR